MCAYLSDKWSSEPYLGAHLRRNDWKWAHKNTISTLEDSVKAIAKVAMEKGLKHIFIATDIQVQQGEEWVERRERCGGCSWAAFLCSCLCFMPYTCGLPVLLFMLHALHITRFRS
jgi:hypothetical protein